MSAVKTGHCTTAERRVARHVRICGASASYCIGAGRIQPGEVSLMHTEFPGGESGYADAAGRPVRMAECVACATRYGRAALLAAPAGPGAETAGGA